MDEGEGDEEDGVLAEFDTTECTEEDNQNAEFAAAVWIANKQIHRRQRVSSKPTCTSYLADMHNIMDSRLQPLLGTKRVVFDFRLVICHNKPIPENLAHNLISFKADELANRIAMICHSTLPIRHLVALCILTGTKHEKPNFAKPLQIGFRKFEMSFSASGAEVLTLTKQGAPAMLYQRHKGPFLVVMDIMKREWKFESPAEFQKATFYSKLCEIYRRYVIDFPACYPDAKNAILPQMIQSIVSDAALVAEFMKTQKIEHLRKQQELQERKLTLPKTKSKKAGDEEGGEGGNNENAERPKKRPRPAQLKESEKKNKVTKEAVDLFSTDEHKKEARKRAMQLYDDVRNGRMYHAEKIPTRGDIIKQNGHWEITDEADSSDSGGGDDGEKEEDPNGTNIREAIANSKLKEIDFSDVEDENEEEEENDDFGPDDLNF